MGYYLNPKNGQTKDDFLVEFGQRIPHHQFTVEELWALKLPDEAYIVLVDNGPFTAAALAYAQHELQEFLNPQDGRPKAVFLVKKHLLRGHIAGADDYLV